jgi:hypothetical protein
MMEDCAPSKWMDVLMRAQFRAEFGNDLDQIATDELKAWDDT